jgi:2-dehydropantoate 2-reductase
MPTVQDPCRIAVVGCGALGQFYAAQLSHAGHHLHLLARRDASTLAQRGIVVSQTMTPQVRSSLEFPLLRVPPERLVVARRPEQLLMGGDVDWVLVAVKTTGLGDVEGLVRPLLGDNTNVVVMCNGLGVEDTFAQWFGPQRIFGLLCFVGVHRDEDASIRHLAFGHVVAGHFLDDVKQRSRLQSLFEGAGIACECPASLLEARWRKLVWNVTFNGLCLLYDTGTDGIVRNPERRAFAAAIAREVVAVGNLDLRRHGQSTRIESEWADLQLERTDTMVDYAPSTLLDARAGRALELDMMLLEPARRARQLGAPTPALDRLIRELEARDPGAR